MAFSTAVPPKRSGDYTRFVSKRATTVPPSTGSVVAIPFTDDWGPYREAVLLNSFDEYLAVFGSPSAGVAPSEGYFAVYNAFRGEDDDAPGAGAVLAYRHGGSAAAKATRQLAAGGTSNALTIEAKYNGSRGNEYAVEIVANATNPATQVDVRLYKGTTLLHTFSGVGSADIQTLRDNINKNASADFTAVGGVNGTKLDALVKTNLAGGNSGTTLVAGDWTTTRTALEPFPFGYLAPANLTDSSILASLETWAKDLNNAEKSKRFFLVKGGVAGEAFSAASARSATANHESVVNLGVGTYRDKALDQTFSTAQLVPRLAGVLAARGGRASISFAYLQDLEIVVGPTESDVLNALDQGVVLLTLGTGGVQFSRGVTTYTTKTDDTKPFDTYKNIKYVTTMANFERDGKEANENGNVLGKLPVNDDTREFLIGREQARLDEYISRGEVRAGARVVLSVDPPPSDDDEFIAIDWIGKFGRSLEQIRRTVYFS